MAILYKDLLICVLYNDTADSSECLTSNVWLMGEELMGGLGGRKYSACIIPLGYKPESGVFDPMSLCNYVPRVD